MANQQEGNATPSTFEKVGAGWTKRNDKGVMITLQLEFDGQKHKFFMFQNTDKKGDTSPDFRVVRSSSDWVANNAASKNPYQPKGSNASVKQEVKTKQAVEDVTKAPWEV